MTDIRAGGADDDDRLPWLEAVDEEDERDGPSVLKLIVAVLIGLAAIGGIVGGAFWILNNRDGGTVETAGGELIQAPDGAYRVKPDDPGGMAVEGKGDTAFAASAGEEPKGAIDTSKMPEAPVTGQQPQQAPPAAKEEPLLKAPAPTNAGEAPAPPKAAGGATVQLGAFSSQASANNAWKALSGRFRYLAPLSHNVVPVTSGGRPLYRLRASGPDAASLCGRLRVAGESCVVVD